MPMLSENHDAHKSCATRQLFPGLRRREARVEAGVGKSTLVDALTREPGRKGLRTGILAVDSTKPFSGGAIFGDRIGVDEKALDSGASTHWNRVLIALVEAAETGELP